VKAIVAALGAGVGADFKVEEMRYGGVAILVDADVDGAHIRTLLHTLFWRHMKPLVQAGRLYVAVAPLYQLRKGRETRYAYSDEERDEILGRWGRGGVTIQRYKGLGEMNPEQLRETIFAIRDEGTSLNEHLLRVEVDDQHRAGHLMSVLMGSDVGPRKRWLLTKWAGEENGGVGPGENGEDDSPGEDAT
jgi:DNA gyrase subunit B